MTIRLGVIAKDKKIDVELYYDEDDKVENGLSSRKSFSEDEVLSLEKYFLSYIGENYICSLNMRDGFMSGHSSDDRWFFIKDCDGVLSSFFSNMKEKYIKDREDLISNNIESLRDISIFCNPSDSFYDYTLISTDGNVANIDLSFKVSDYAREISFFIDLLDLMFDYNYPYIALIERYWFESGNEAKSLKSYTLKQGRIQIHFDYNLFDMVLEWLNVYEDCTEKKVIKVLGGGENAAKPLEERDYSVLKKINLIRGGKL